MEIDGDTMARVITRLRRAQGQIGCAEDDHLRRIITDRDIVTRCIARGVDPGSITAGELAHGMPVTIESQADVTEVLRPMEPHQIHRLSVIESQQPLGMISQAGPATREAARSAPARRRRHRRHRGELSVFLGHRGSVSPRRQELAIRSGAGSAVDRANRPVFLPR